MPRDHKPFVSLTVEPLAQTDEIYGITVSTLQGSDVAVNGTAITGTLKYIGSGEPATTWGAGNFIALNFDDLATNATSIKVGLEPSVSSGLVEISAEDHSGIFKITDKNDQKFVTVVTDGVHTVKTEYDLRGLTLNSSGA